MEHSVSPSAVTVKRVSTLIACVLIFLAMAHLDNSAEQAAIPQPPVARMHPVREVLHGVEVVDPYRWLEDRNSPETESWIQAQNRYTQSLLHSIPGRQKLQDRITRLFSVDTSSAPLERDGRYFFQKRVANRELAAIYMREGAHGEDRILLDPHLMSADGSINVQVFDVSRDGTLLAYVVRQGGQGETAVRFFDIDARKDLPDRLPWAMHNAVLFRPDREGVYYVNQESPGPRAYYHKFGTDPARDPLVFGKEFGPERYMVAALSEDGRYLLFDVAQGALKTDIYYQGLSGQGPILPLVKGVDASFHGAIGGDDFFLQTDWKAPKGRIMAVSIRNPAVKYWREVIPETDAVIDTFSLVGDKLVVSYTLNVQWQVKIFETTGRHVRDVKLPPNGYAWMNGKWGNPKGFLFFSSYHVPWTLYLYDVATGRREVFSQMEVPFDPDRLEVERVWYKSKDGTKVPMFLVHAKDLKPDGRRPTLLTGYGGFGNSQVPLFSPIAVLWAERGGIYAVPSLRGGGEFGEEWHRAGMLEKKQNVFDDFIAAAEWLCQNGYTNPSRLAISGMSNGGLLVGAALTQRPDLFQAAVCRYALLDMIRATQAGSGGISEYGSADDPVQFKYLLAYSPYHHVQPGVKYPATLFVTGDLDSIVNPLHARKMTARLQSATASGLPVLLRYEAKAGHFVGGLPRSKQIDEAADEQAFLFWQLKIGLNETRSDRAKTREK